MADDRTPEQQAADNMRVVEGGSAINRWENLDRKPVELAETLRRYAPNTYAVVRRAGRSHHCRCRWCCQSTPPDKRGEAHKGCAP